MKCSKCGNEFEETKSSRTLETDLCYICYHKRGNKEKCDHPFTSIHTNWEGIPESVHCKECSWWAFISPKKVSHTDEAR